MDEPLITPQVLVDIPAKNSECPVWNPIDRMLYWSDIPNGFLYRCNPINGQHELICEAGEQIGGLVVCEDGGIVLLLEEGRIKKWRNGATEVILGGISGETGHRFNDAIADPAGRIISGMMGDGKEDLRLYVIEPQGSVRALLHTVRQSNGMAFGERGRNFFHTDTVRGTITRFSYDAARGELGPVQQVIALDPASHHPDGLAIDDRGHLWSAQWGHGCLICLIDGKEAQRILLPTSKVSSVAFGGEDMGDMFITTAGGDARSADDPFAGSVFRCRTDQGGVAPHLAKF